MPCIFICQIWQLYPSQQRKYFSSTLNKYPRTGERNPWGCREKQEYLNRQEHGKLSSSSCLKQLEGRGDDNPWETQPKHVFFSRPNPSKLQEISASFTVLPKDTILNVAGHARDVVWDAAQCRFSQSYYKEVVMKQNESVWLKSAVLTQNISFFFFFSKIFLMCGTSWQAESLRKHKELSGRSEMPSASKGGFCSTLLAVFQQAGSQGGQLRGRCIGRHNSALTASFRWEGGSTRGAEAPACLRVAPQSPPPHHPVTLDMFPPFHRRAKGGSLGHLRVESQTQLFAITLYLLPMVQNPKCSFSLLFLSLSHVRPFATPWTVVHGILQARILEWVAFFFQGIFPT